MALDMQVQGTRAVAFAPCSMRKRDQGARNHLSGVAAEESVCRHYQRLGYVIAARRWRSLSGEIDLVARKGLDLVIVEVKARATHQQAAAALGRAQQIRIMQTAQDYLFDVHMLGRDPALCVDMRFDLALVDGRGFVEICEAAFHH